MGMYGAVVTPISSLLASWGIDKRVSWATNGYPSSCTFARFMVNPGEAAEKGLRHVPLSTDLHNQVDAAVSSMKPRKPEHYKIVCYAYIGRMADHVIGERLGLSRSSVRGLRMAAEAWVESRLDTKTDFWY